MSENPPTKKPKMGTKEDKKKMELNILDSNKKCFNDPIHGTIMLHPLLVKVIDTPQFQRLRNIKQLGGNYFVYPGASHNRFEHSIGTCHLAGKLVRHLKAEHPDLISDKDVLCVELAGLCHDLGHGPFSHMFDHRYLKEVSSKSKEGLIRKEDVAKETKHEERSCKMFDHLLETNHDVKKAFEECFGDTINKDIKFVKELINTKEMPDEDRPYEERNEEKGFLYETWPYEGRSEEKSFLYEIISNQRNGVDVDKWDYFARDCHHLGISNSFDHNRFMMFMKVLKKKNKDNENEIDPKDPYYQICARDKECKNLYEMFHTRTALHRRGYQHKKSSAVEAMICEAMVLANDFIFLEGKNGKKKMSQAIGDIVAFQNLTDDVFHQIRCLEEEGSQQQGEDGKLEARKIMERVYKRDIYSFIGVKKLPQTIFSSSGDSDQNKNTVYRRIKEWNEKIEKTIDDKLDKKEVVYRKTTFSCGKKDQNPVDYFLFYSKENPDTPKKIKQEELSYMLPQQFIEVEWEVYCKSKDKKKKKEVKRQFDQWIEATKNITA